MVESVDLLLRRMSAPVVGSRAATGTCMTRDTFIVTLKMQRRLAPFLLFRALVFCGLAVVVLAVSAGGAMVALLWVTVLAPGPSTASALSVGAMGGFVVGILLLVTARGMVLYFVRAGYVALIVAVLDEETVPQGRAQIGAAAGAIKRRYGSASNLSALHKSLRDVLAALAGLVQGISALVLPLPGLHRANRLQRVFLRLALSRLDEVVLAHTLRRDTPNPWLAARHALVLHAEVARAMIIRSARQTTLLWACCTILFVVLLPVGSAVASVLPGQWALETLACTGLCTWVVKCTVLEPLMLTALIRASFARTDPLAPNPDWEDKLDTASAAFAQMGQYAQTWQPPVSARNAETLHGGPGGEAQGG